MFHKENLFIFDRKEMGDKTFQAADYVVFGLMLVISAGIGFFYAWKDKKDKKQNSEEFLLGGRNLSVRAEE